MDYVCLAPGTSGHPLRLEAQSCLTASGPWGARLRGGREAKRVGDPGGAEGPGKALGPATRYQDNREERKWAGQADGAGRWGQLPGAGGRDGQTGKGWPNVPPGGSIGLSALPGDWPSTSQADFPHATSTLPGNSPLPLGSQTPAHEDDSARGLEPAVPLPPASPQHLSLSGGSSQDVIIANTRVAVPALPGPASEGRQLCPLIHRASLPIRGHSSPLTGKPLLGKQKNLRPSCNVLCIF